MNIDSSGLMGMMDTDNSGFTLKMYIDSSGLNGVMDTHSSGLKGMNKL